MNQGTARRLAALFAAGLIITVPIEIGSETFTLTTVYPSPSGIYTTLVTTGNPPGAASKNSIFARNGGNVFMAPGGGLNNPGWVGIGTGISLLNNAGADTPYPNTKLKMGGNLDMNNNRIGNALDPVANSDVATKGWVLGLASGPGSWTCTVRSFSGSVPCVSPEKAISGGCIATTAGMVNSAPTSPGEGWQCFCPAGCGSVTAYANCCQ